MDSLRKLHRLSWSNRWLLLRASFALPLTALALRWLGLERYRAFLDRPTEKASTPSTRQARITARMVKAAAGRGFYRARCLEQSVVLWWFLRRQGFPCELRIGVRKDSGRLEAHAWVEVRGLVLNEGDAILRHFTPFDRPIFSSVVRSR